MSSDSQSGAGASHPQSGRSQGARRVPARMSVPRFVSAKRQGRKLAVLTAYDYLWASLIDAAGVDAILVGDSLGMVVQGRSSTLPVTLDQIIYHGEMVARATRRALVIVDMPFLSFQVSPQQAVENAGRILKETGAAAVKLEGGLHQTETIQALVRAGIPVMGHIGMQPQSIHAYGSHGRIQRDTTALVRDARAAEEAGAFSLVLELVAREVARAVTEAVSIPTIGIGAGPHCDGQVLVSQDMFGLTPEFTPKFLKRYANLHEHASRAAQEFVAEVQEGVYPDDSQSHD